MWSKIGRRSKPDTVDTNQTRPFVEHKEGYAQENGAIGKHQST